MSVRRSQRSLPAISLLATVSLTLAACGGSGDGGGGGGGEQSGEPIEVGVVFQTTGPTGLYGEQVQAGLEAGLDYATDGTNEVNGRPVEFRYADDGRDATRAISAFTEMVGQGVQVFAGTVDTGIAVQLATLAEQNQALLIGGNSVGDGLTGLNPNTFRASRQIAQEAATIRGLIEEPGANVTVLAQDYATGQGYVTAIQDALTDANVSEILVPLSATEFTPYAQQVASAAPDLLVVIFYGETTAALWQALDQQGVTSSTQVIAPLVEPTSYGQYGPSVGDIRFFAQYCPLCSDTEENQALLEAVPDASLSTADGFTNALMLVHALEASPDDVPTMIDSLEGWSFSTPKGDVSVREGDHALEQPMFIVSLVPGADGELQPELVETVDAETVSPPEQ